MLARVWGSLATSRLTSLHSPCQPLAAAATAAGIDTDKFDYLYRDAHALALPRGFDYKRIMYRRVKGRIASESSGMAAEVPPKR